MHQLRTLAVFSILALASAPEARAACSVSPPTDFDGNGTLDVRILGDAGPQEISIGEDDSGYRVDVDCNGDGDFDDTGVDVTTGDVVATIETWDIQGRGRDRIFYDEGFGAAGSRYLLVTLGPATDAEPNRVEIRPFLASTGIQSLVADVLGGPGPDEVVLRGAARDSALVLRADLGAGNDRVDLGAMNLATSSVTIDVALGAGSNRLDVSVPNSMDNSAYAVGVEGSDAAASLDRVSWKMSESPLIWSGARVRLAANLLGGNDVFEGVLQDRNAARDGAEFRVRVRGGAGNDLLTLETPAAGPLPLPNGGFFSYDLLGGPGADVVLTDLTGVSGAGTLRVRASGGEGADAVWAGVTADSAASVPRLDLSLDGGSGGDLLALDVQDPASAADFTRRSILDGGAGADLCLLHGADGAPLVLSCESGS